MRFSIIELLTAAFSAADSAVSYGIRLGQVDGVKQILIGPNTGVVFAAGKEDGIVEAILRVSVLLPRSVGHARYRGPLNSIMVDQ